MSNLLVSILGIIKIIIVIKIASLLFLTQLYPKEYPMSELTWWIYFLVFDTWLGGFLLNFNETPDDN